MVQRFCRIGGYGSGFGFIGIERALVCIKAETGWIVPVSTGNNPLPLNRRAESKTHDPFLALLGWHQEGMLGQSVWPNLVPTLVWRMHCIHFTYGWN